MKNLVILIWLSDGSSCKHTWFAILVPNQLVTENQDYEKWNQFIPSGLLEGVAVDFQLSSLVWFDLGVHLCSGRRQGMKFAWQVPSFRTYQGAWALVFRRCF